MLLIFPRQRTMHVFATRNIYKNLRKSENISIHEEKTVITLNSLFRVQRICFINIKKKHYF